MHKLIKHIGKKNFDLMQRFSNNARMGLKRECAIEKGTGIGKIRFPMKKRKMFS